MQDERTGHFTVPPGTTTVKGIVTKIQRKWNGESKSPIEVTKTEETITGIIEREEEQETIWNFQLGYQLDWAFAGPYQGNIHTSQYEIIPNEAKPMTPPDLVGGKFETVPVLDKAKKGTDYYREQLNAWEKNAGGMLCFYAPAKYAPAKFHMANQADYKIKLYTVLSAHRPNEEPLKLKPNAVPNWEALEELVSARFPDKDKAWAMRGVQQYKYFLELKKESNDYDSMLFSPSALLDEIWHAHLSFTERYQHDVRAFCGQASKIIEHTPVLGQEALKRYERAYRTHKARMQKKNESVDSEFWPDPTSNNELKEDMSGGSDDQLTYEEQKSYMMCNCG